LFPFDGSVLAARFDELLEVATDMKIPRLVPK